MDEFIHWPKPYLLLLATCDEILVAFSVGDTIPQFTIDIERDN